MSAYDQIQIVIIDASAGACLNSAAQAQAAAVQAEAAAVAAQLGGAGSLVLPAARAALFAAMQSDGLFAGFQGN